MLTKYPLLPQDSLLAILADADLLPEEYDPVSLKNT